MADTIAKRRELESLRAREDTLIKEIRFEEDRCKHEWSETVFDPEKEERADFHHFEPHGSDPIPIYTYYYVNVNRWRRTCKKCGKSEYTKETKPTHFVPHFE